MTERPGADAERLNLALDTARLGDWNWDAESDLVSFSTRTAYIVGIPPRGNVTRAALEDLIAPDDRESTRQSLKAAIASGADYDIEYRLVRGDLERWVTVRGRPRYDAEGRLAGMFGVVQDITSDRLLVHVDDAVRPLTDPEEITFTAARLLGTHLRVNRCAYCTVEDDEDTFILFGNYTHGTHSIVGTYRFRQFGAECLALMRAGKPYVVSDSEDDPRIDDTDRAAYRLTAIRAVICVPILKAGRFVAAMAVHDVGPRQWTAAEVSLVLRVASRCWESIQRAHVEHERTQLLEVAERANRAKDEFLAMLGHELRNPLSPILTAVQLMKLRADSSSQKEVTIIERQVRHLTRLVDDLLDVSRIARGKVNLTMEPIEIGEVVTRAIEMTSPLFEQAAQTVAVDVPPAGVRVSGDAARLSQVVSNLLTNASKYTPPKGHIAVTAATEGGDVVLRVRDTGMGIAPDVLPTVFDLFVQGRQALDRSQGGLGLGLTIVRSLVERHGGQVSAHSDGPGSGSEFVIRLPAVHGAAKAPAPAIAPAIKTAAARPSVLLMVDDNRDAADLLAQGLRAMGHEVHVAHDGPEALRMAGQRSYHVAFLDIGLPVMDGFELAERLRRLSGFRETRLVAVTGYGQASDRKRTTAAGFDEHLVKPVDLETVEQLIAGFGAGKRA